jgi:hypothetical protein
LARDWKIHQLTTNDQSSEGYMPNFPTPVGSSFSAIDALALKDADVSLHFLGSSAIFTEPVNDPWFLAQQQVPAGTTYYDYPTQMEYVAEWPVNVVACAAQSQTCLIQTGECEDLGPLANSNESTASKIQLTERQQAIYYRFSRPDMTGLVTQLGTENLLAMDYCYDGVCAPVPDNQWMFEFENYFSTTLAAMHQNSLAYVAGPLNSIYRSYWAPPIANDSWMCDSQIVIRTDYSSFSILGIALILCIGGLMVMADLVFGWKQVHGKLLSDGAVKDWHLLSLFHLQRLALEGRQSDTVWKHLEKEIPIMRTPESLVNFHELVGGRTELPGSTTDTSARPTNEQLQLHEKHSPQVSTRSLPNLHKKDT